MLSTDNVQLSQCLSLGEKIYSNLPIIRGRFNWFADYPCTVQSYIFIIFFLIYSLFSE